MEMQDEDYNLQYCLLKKTSISTCVGKLISYRVSQLTWEFNDDFYIRLFFHARLFCQGRIQK